jgi:hypothetical protein
MMFISSIYNFLKCRSNIIITLALVATFATACVQKKDEYTTTTGGNVTGKGNGGNNLKIAKTEIEEILQGMPTNIKMVYEGLSYLYAAEKIRTGSTDLSMDKELIEILRLMFDGGQGKTVLDDIDTPDNLKLQKAPCVDFRGVENAAAAEAGKIHGAICFSTSKIQSVSIKNMENAAMMFMVGLAAHEFVHHFYVSGDKTKDEAAARKLQNFVEQQLASVSNTADDSIISSEENAFIIQFKQGAKDVFDNVVEASNGTAEP